VTWIRRGDRPEQVAGTGPEGACTRLRIPASELLLPILFFVLVASCSHAPARVAGPALGERFSLRPGESAAIRGERVTVVFERILSDSRCAIDVQCIRAGEARASFRLEPAGSAEIPFELDTDRDRIQEVGGYRVSLFDVSPAPKSTVRIAPADYRVELTVH
jgi:hypothetical protein